jgi:hypothetical protein
MAMPRSDRTDVGASGEYTLIEPNGWNCLELLPPNVLCVVATGIPG